VNTFLPFENFQDCANCLDNKRLGKQRVEAKQIIDVLEGKKTGWASHPAVRMWEGYVPSLKRYYNTIVKEWKSRGFKNSMPYLQEHEGPDPPWLGDIRVHISHRANLKRKDPVFYSFDIEPFEGYYWPVEVYTERSKKVNEHWSEVSNG